MYTAFLSVAIACGTPGLLAALALGASRALAVKAWCSLYWEVVASSLCHLSRAGQLSNVMGCLTTYGIGSAPP